MTKDADKDLWKLDKVVKQRLIDFFETRVIPSDNPRLFGKALTGRFAGFWSYRVGDYRVIADVQDRNLTILAVSIDHRREVYE